MDTPRVSSRIGKKGPCAPPRATRTGLRCHTGLLMGASLGVIAVMLTGFSVAQAQTASQHPPQRRAMPQAQQGQAGVAQGEQVLFSADRMSYDEARNLIIATGNVEITQGPRLLFADQVTYNQNTGQVTAQGNVRLLEPTGDVVFADRVVLEDEMKAGVIHNIRLRMADNSRMAAASARRWSDNKTSLNKAVYSPCEPCKDDPSRAPVWQIKAEKVIHDQEDQDIEYYNAFMEMFGIPVFYTPFFTHPDPTVERRSGLLTPGFGYSTDYGVLLKIPYYWSMSQDMDATITPIIVTEEGVIGLGEFRKRFTFGQVEIEGSATLMDRETDSGEIEKDVFRGHIKAKGQFNIDEVWRAGFDVARTSDDTYMSRYKIRTDSVLESKAGIEGFMDRSYVGLHGYAYQGLREDDRHGTTPVVAPEMEVNLISDPGWMGSHLEMDMRAFSVARNTGTDSHRVSLGGRWILPLTFGNGQLLTTTAAIRGDAYHVNEYTDPSDGQTKDGSDGRIYPYLALDWRYPFARQGRSSQSVIEPLVSLVVAPNGGNGGLFPNEDSVGFALDDTAILRHNRFQGIDRVEGGSRINYGLNLGHYTLGGSVTAFLGQSFRFEPDDTFKDGSGLEDKLSDYVGRIDLQPTDAIDLLYRFRLDRENLAPKQHELKAVIGRPILTLTADYLFIEADSETLGYGSREELSAGLSSRFSDNWSTNLSWRRDFANNQDLSWGAGLVYRDECITVNGSYLRSFYRDREIEPNNSFFLRLTFKNLGEVATSF